MSILGIIAEYNPLHSGHVHHLEAAKALTGCKYTVVVMSGNFVQRGEPALADKYIRTKFALMAGADLVLELPVYSATASAEYFAEGAVKLLDATGIVNKLCFGSELGSIEHLDYIATLLSKEETEFKSVLKQYLRQGYSFPQARENALEVLYGQSFKDLQTSNNILAVEYIKALKKIDSNIKPYTVKRIHSTYNGTELDKPFASATAIRQSIINSDFEPIKRLVPDYVYRALKDKTETTGFSDLDNLSLILHYLLRTKSVEELQAILGMQEGLEQRILRMAGEAFPITSIIHRIKTKRYTFTKLQRLILHILLNITKDDFSFYQKTFPHYIRVLGFREESRILLKYMHYNAKVPVITNLKNAHRVLCRQGAKVLDKEIETTDIYNISLNRPYRPNSWEYSVPLVKI